MSKKIAQLVVEEINSVDRIQMMLDIGVRLIGKLSPDEVASFGFGCGNRCDSVGFGCGKGCLSGLPLTPELIRIRYAVDVLDKNGIKPEEMAAIRKDFKRFQKDVTAAVEEKFSLENLQKRIHSAGKANN